MKNNINYAIESDYNNYDDDLEVFIDNCIDGYDSYEDYIESNFI